MGIPMDLRVMVVKHMTIELAWTTVKTTDRNDGVCLGKEMLNKCHI
jgi:hypothetical protein